MSTPNKAQTKKFCPIDGTYYLVNTKEGRLLAKCWNHEDAALIASAPELLEALRLFLAEYANGPHGCDPDREARPEVRAARAAIAKAEGRA